MKLLKKFLFVLMLIIIANTVHAQFLKNIVINTKQTAQNRTSEKANQITNKVFDKADSLTQIKLKHKKKKHNEVISDTLQAVSYNIIMLQSIYTLTIENTMMDRNSLLNNCKCYYLKRCFNSTTREDNKYIDFA